MSSFVRTVFASPVLTLFFGVILLQGVHELEHAVQVLQRQFLGIPNGSGIAGSVADIEPIHFVYNTLFLALLAAVYLRLDLDTDGPRIHGRAVFGLLTFALAFQVWHLIEHVFKLAQYLELNHLNGTGGILGQGPGALWPTFGIPLLHLAYNSIAYLPALAAFVFLVRRGIQAAETRIGPDPYRIIGQPDLEKGLTQATLRD